MKLTLDKLAIGQQATIEQFTDLDLSLKLLEMGCTPGETITMLSYATLGGPIAIKIDNYLLSLRKKEASTVLVNTI
jgi:ferrous iron transport protein A